MSTTIPTGVTSTVATRPARLLGLTGIAAGLLWAVLTVWEYQAGLQDGPLIGARLVNQIGFAIAIAGYVALLIGVHRARPAGPGRVARAITGLFAAAWLVILAGQLLSLLADLSGDDNPLLGIGGLLQGVASLATGIAVARSGRWSGWQRWWPLLLALYYVGVLLVPVFAGHEPTMLTESIWAVTYAVLGIALATATRRADAGQRSLPA
ncbi:hypothetical protein ACFHYQ_15220 [Sphaerimonospora cavernae]|uniref:DUF998 domain-containing protein n=1 Tax=Sphaerimonospora cavernae TaxID=1740611 RepID=A0ABV6U5D2_9ACTN